MYPGMFVAGISISGKQISYHMEMEHFDGFPAPERDTAPEWDGHAPEDVLNILFSIWH